MHPDQIEREVELESESVALGKDRYSSAQT